MGRRRLPPGTHGEINTRDLGPNVVEAHCYYRTHDGERRFLTRRRAGVEEAKEALRKFIVTLADTGAHGEMSPDTLISEAAEQWLNDDIAADVAAGVLAPTTLDQYRSLVRRWVKPRIGALTAREIEQVPTRVNKIITDARSLRSLAAARSVRTVLKSLCDYMIRHGALTRNPVTVAKRLRTGRSDQPTVKSMTEEQIAEMVTGLVKHGAEKMTGKRGKAAERARVWVDLADIAIAELATGARVGEIIALTADEIGTDDDDRSKVLIDWHVVFVTGRGAVRREGRKGNAPAVEPSIPGWGGAMFARRIEAAPAGSGRPLFANADGGLLDPSNTASRLRQALDAIGFGWVTSHVWRKTVARVMRDAGCTLEEIAAQLGNSPDVVKRHYLEPVRKPNPKAVKAIETLMKVHDVYTIAS